MFKRAGQPTELHLFSGLDHFLFAENSARVWGVVTDPAHPRYLRHLPGQEGTYEGGGGQMTRVCDGKDLPKGNPNAVYLLRTFGGAAHEIWNVADPANPELVVRLDGLKDTHKSWWECNTGIAFLVSGAANWRVRRMTEVYDLSDPAKPVKIRDFGLPGQEPGSAGRVPTELHGMISTGPGGNRVYFGYGTNKGGILQIVDRDKLIHGPAEPTPENLRAPVIARDGNVAAQWRPYNLSMGKMTIPDSRDKFGSQRDMVMIVDESLVNECQGRGPSNGVVRRCDDRERNPWWYRVIRCRKPTESSASAAADWFAFIQRKHGSGFLQENCVRDLVQCRCSGDRYSRSVPSQGSWLFHPPDYCGD